MAAAAGPHLYRRRQRQGQRLLTGGGERRRATATAGEERRGERRGVKMGSRDAVETSLDGLLGFGSHRRSGPRLFGVGLDLAF